MRHWKMHFTVAGRSEKLECFDIEMIIDNLSKLTDRSNSPTFMTTFRDCKTVWQIFVEVPMGAKKLRVGLKRVDSNTCNVKASMFYEIQNDKYEIYWRDSVTHIYNSQNVNYCYCDYFDMPSRQQSVSLLKGKIFKLSTDKIIIKGVVLVKELELISPNHATYHKCLNECFNDLERDYKNLYNNPKFTDIEFRFADGKLLAHKNILSSRSRVFEKTFEKNVYQKFIEVVDVEKLVFDIFLRFLYSGIIENRNSAIIMPLYVLGYKYEVYTLSRICASILASDISVKIAIHTLELANTHGDYDLREAAIDFVSKNFSQVSQTSEWDKFLSSNPCFASSVLKRVSKSLEQAITVKN